MNIYDKFIKPVWTRYGIWPFAALIVVVLAAAYLFQVDLGGYFNHLLGVQP